jgi:hypothetical protein
MKYILFEGENFPEEMHVFFESSNHKQVAMSLGVASKIISAGFIKIKEDGQAVCYDHSESLKVDSRPERDAKVFNRQNKCTRIHS